MTELDEAGLGMEIAQAVPTPQDSQQPQETRQLIGRERLLKMLLCLLSWSACPVLMGESRRALNREEREQAALAGVPGERGPSSCGSLRRGTITPALGLKPPPGSVLPPLEGNISPPQPALPSPPFKSGNSQRIP